MDTNAPNFDQLALAAHPEVDQHGSIEALDELWSTLFALPAWHFLGEPKTIHNALEGAKPFQWDRRNNGEKWLLLFTELSRAKDWAARQDFGESRDQVNFISLTPDEARQHFRDIPETGVRGVRFNEGSKFGWMAPLEDIEAIYEHLQKKSST